MPISQQDRQRLERELKTARKSLELCEKNELERQKAKAEAEREFYAKGGTGGGAGRSGPPQRGPCDDAKDAVQKLETAIVQIQALSKMLDEVSAVPVKSDWDRNVESVVRMTIEFLTGNGPQSYAFGPDTPESRGMAQSATTQRALDQWYQKNAGADPGSLTPMTDVDPGFGVGGLIAADANPIEQFVGNATYTITPDAARGVLAVHVWNRTSITSLLYGEGPSYERHSAARPIGAAAPGGNTVQDYDFEIPINWGRLNPPQPVPPPPPPQPTPSR